VVSVADSRGCLASVSVNLNYVTSTMSATISTLGSLDSSVSCYGSNDGALTVQVSSGIPPYTYQWVGPTGVYTTATLFNLSAGTYSVLVTDFNGCVVTTYQQLTEPAPLIYEVVSTTNTSCLGACDGALEVHVEGGNTPYIYTAYLLNNQTGASSPYNVSGFFPALQLVDSVCTGNYTVTINDDNGCDGALIFGGSDQAVLNTAITTAVTTSSLDILCYGDSTGVLSVVNPINPPYWLDLNADTIGTTTTIDNLLAGDYILHAGYNSINGCTTVDTVTVLESSFIHSDAIVTHVSCNGEDDGSVVTTTLGGGGNYTYSWSPISSTGSDLMNLMAGVYELTITDAHNCSVTEMYTITEPALLVATVSASQIYILNSSVVGGTPPYSYSWIEQTQPGISLGTLSSYTVGANGTYYVIVTDLNNCTSQSNSTTYLETGILDLNKEIHLSVYPNPFREETTVDFGQIISKATITIVDVYGKLIEIHELKDTDKYSIKGTNKASGVYFMEIEIDEVNIKSKIIIK
jgi:hypothetical protein